VAEGRRDSNIRERAREQEETYATSIVFYPKRVLLGFCYQLAGYGDL
jgi:hypothetical protein